MGLPIDPDENIVVTCGSTEAMMAAMMTACNPGDRVVIFSPLYENYVADTILSGAEPIYVPLHPPSFRFDPDELRRAFAQKPKAMILCNPANPSGRVFTRSELELIAELAEAADAFVITDGLRAHSVSAARTHLLRIAAGHGEANHHVRVAFEDLFHHRLALGLHHRRAGNHRGRS